MAPRILIPGGYGVFGRLLARELLSTTDATIVVAGRDAGKAERACRVLGPRARPLALDLTDMDAVAGAAGGSAIVACAAGPFHALPRGLPRVVAEAGAHWLDIADDVDWVVPVLDDRRAHDAADRAGRAIMPGLSSVPLIAMVLARLSAGSGSSRARAALFIGNRNTKGTGAIASALRSGFHEPRPVSYPFGTRLGYRFASPFEVLVARGLGIEGELRVTLESALAGRFVQAGGRLAGRPGVARGLSLLARPFGRFGTDMGCVTVEIGPSGAALSGDGQRLAILPCAIAAAEILAGRTARGTIEASDWLSPGDWLRRLRAGGLRYHDRRS